MAAPLKETGPLFDYPKATKTGNIPFVPPGSDLQCETAYCLWGDLTANQTPLICLHGGPGAASHGFLPLSFLHKRAGIPVILYDQIGCGESTHLRQTKGDLNFWNFDLFIAELKNLIKYLGIETYDLLGHSWGGMLAVKYTLTQPPGLRKLLLSSTVAAMHIRRKVTERQRAQLPSDMQETLKKCESERRTDAPEYKAAMGAFYKRHLCRADPFPKEFLDTVKSLQEDDTVYSTLYGTSPLDFTGPLKDVDFISELPQITGKTVPGGILLQNGNYDTHQDEVMAPFFTQTKARVKWVRLAESSHMAFLDEPEAFLDVVQEFLTAE